MNKAIQAKHINDDDVLRFIAMVHTIRDGWTVTYDFRDGDKENGIPPFPHQFPERVWRAKMDKLIRRGLVSGCACGCRGDFELTHDKGWGRLIELGDVEVDAATGRFRFVGSARPVTEVLCLEGR